MSEPWPFGALVPRRYGLILADPPWAYTMRSANGYDRSPEAHYRTMDAAAIGALPVARLAAPHCLLVLWSTWPHLAQSMEVLRLWGFAYASGGAWFKRAKAGGLAMGTGWYMRSACEPFLIGKRGAPRIVSRSERNGLEAEPHEPEAEHIPDAINALRREHSRKPDEMRAMLERMMPHAAKVELFARQPWPGCDVWGDAVAGAQP